MAHREVEKRNRAMRRIRHGIERDGFSSGSLPSIQFDLGGLWNDPYGGRLVGHCRYVAANYPELAKLAMSELEEIAKCKKA